MAANEALVESAGQSLSGSVVLGRYRVIRPIARGGMGMVYLGRVEGAAGFAKPVVIKAIDASLDHKESAQLFAREARIVSNLQHPGIVAVIDFGKVGSGYAMVLEYVHGFHLGQWSRYLWELRQTMPVEQAVHVMLQVLDALSYAHGLKRADGVSLGIVHRDVSPANILLDSRGHIKLHDFGIARMADDEYKTQDGTFRGTLPFMPPESLAGSAPTPRYDQYSSAVVLYQLLAGKNPFKGREPRETVARVLSHTPEPLSLTRDDVPRDIEAAIARAMSKDPEQRFASTEDFVAAIRAGLQWDEEAAARKTAAQITEDFEGDEMARYLGVESLASRNAAWRDVQDAPVGERVVLSSSPPKLVPQSAQTSLPPTWRPPGRPIPTSERRSRRATPGWVGVSAIGALAAALAAVAFAMFMSSRKAAPEAPKYVLIEKQDTAPERATPNAVPTTAVAQTPAPSAAIPTAAPASPPANKAGAANKAVRAPDRGSELARAFQAQQPKIQACFQQHADRIEGTPELLVRFQVDAAGNVQQASLSPAAIAGSALGQCILAVARASRFGSQAEPISFSIPIAARVVKR